MSLFAKDLIRVLKMRQRIEYECPIELDDPFATIRGSQSTIYHFTGRRAYFHTIFLRKTREDYQHYGIVEDGKPIPPGTEKVKDYKEGDIVSPEDEDGRMYKFIHTHTRLGNIRFSIGGIMVKVER